MLLQYTELLTSVDDDPRGQRGVLSAGRVHVADVPERVELRGDAVRVRLEDLPPARNRYLPPVPHDLHAVALAPAQNKT